MEAKELKLPLIIAVDFDGTLVSDKFPDIGKPNKFMFELCKRWRNEGYRIILWTCRDGERLKEAVEFCFSQGLFFDAVNCNIPEVQYKYGGDTRKVFADFYIDDKALLVEGVNDLAFRIPNSK